tara:strand:+ start:1181 stop:3394 length:2214 start_codon:yes stop_codon:yes gene_type:complete
MKKIIFIVLFVILFSNFVLSDNHETTITNEKDISKLVNKELEEGSISVAKTKIKKVGERNILEVEKGGFVKIGERLYSNIGKGTFILDKKGNLVKAEITTNENKGVYTFEGISKKITVPPNTKIVYEDGKVTFEKDKEYLIGEHKVNSISNTILFGEALNGEFIVDGITIDNGKVKFTDRGIFIEKGKVLYKGLKFEVVNKESQVLIPNINADLSKFNGNFLRINDKDKTLEVKTSINGVVNFQVLETNKIFSLLDKKDNLHITLSNGHGIKVTNREDKKLIPSIEETLSNKRSSFNIKNGLLEVRKKDGKLFYKINLPGKKEIEKNPGLILDKRYQTAPFILKTSKGIVKFGSANNLAFFDNSGKIISPLLIKNIKAIPVDENLRSHTLQSLEGLKKKYPNINFDIIYMAGGIFPVSLYDTKNINDLIEKSKFKLRIYPGKSIPPSALQELDKWLSLNKGKIDLIKNIYFFDDFNAHAREKDTLIFGRLLHPLYDNYLVKTRKKDRWEVYDHEYVHLDEKNIEDREEKYIKKTGEKIKGFESYMLDISQKAKNIIFKSPLFEKRFNELCLKKIKKERCQELSEEITGRKKNMLGRGIVDLFAIQILETYFQTNKRFTELGGVPNMHALDNKGRELMAGFLESPLPNLIKIANQLDKKGESTLQAKNYKTLAQIAFDANFKAMSISKYKEWIKLTEGKECTTNDCIEFRCLKYKTICCEDFWRSPNCQEKEPEDPGD